MESFLSCCPLKRGLPLHQESTGSYGDLREQRSMSSVLYEERVCVCVCVREKQRCRKSSKIYHVMMNCHVFSQALAHPHTHNRMNQSDFHTKTFSDNLKRARCKLGGYNDHNRVGHQFRLLFHFHTFSSGIVPCAQIQVRTSV